MLKCQVSNYIEEMRKELIELGMRKPLTDPEVVKISQRLDRLLNEYEYLRQNYRFGLELKGA